MSAESKQRVVKFAGLDIERGDLTRAKHRLRSLLHDSPCDPDALRLLGSIYFRQRDYRNAVAYWSKCGYWSNDALLAANKVFRIIVRALEQEKIEVARHHLVAFAGSSPPGEVGERLTLLRDAYFKLGRKRSKLLGMAYVPISGILFLGMLSLVGLVLGAGWSWFRFMIGLSLVATIITLVICWAKYCRASAEYRRSLILFKRLKTACGNS
ncbi:MAG: hypothetical protein K6T99_08630 [Armatimonadetes bacterium]|nr:hypothetical protein [Armatimonadota bacterium]